MEIGKNRVFIIAEAGVNHNGDIELAKRLIEAAAACGVDAVKFQTWVTEEVLVRDAPKAEYQIANDGDSSQFEMAKRLELSFQNFRELRDYAVEMGITFLSTPDDKLSLDFLADELNLPAIKIGSGEVNNLPFLEEIGKKNKELILSTGMSSINEVVKAYNTLKEHGAGKITVLHCTSNYPASFDSINLRAMLAIGAILNCQVGYSDHTPGTEVSVAAVALGARVIEKHFTIDRNLPGPDHLASLEPKELKQLVSQIRNVEMALSGTGEKVMHKSEVETKKVVTRGIYIRKSMSAGEVIEMEHLAFKRPVSGYSAADYKSVLGRKLTVNKRPDDPLMPNDIE